MKEFTKQSKVTDSIVIGYNDNDNPETISKADVKAVTVKEINALTGSKHSFNIKIAESFLLGKITKPLADAHKADEEVRNFKKKNEKGKLVGYSIKEMSEKLVNVSGLFDNPRDSIVGQLKTLLRFTQLELQNGWACHVESMGDRHQDLAKPTPKGVITGLREVYPTRFRGGAKPNPKTPTKVPDKETNANLQQELENERALGLKLRGSMRSHIEKALEALKEIDDQFAIDGMEDVIKELTAANEAAKSGKIEKTAPPKRK